MARRQSTIRPHQGTPPELPPALEQATGYFSPLYRAVFRYLKDALQVEPCPVFYTRECNLNSNQETPFKSLQGSTLSLPNM